MRYAIATDHKLSIHPLIYYFVSVCLWLGIKARVVFEHAFDALYWLTGEDTVSQWSTTV